MKPPIVTADLNVFTTAGEAWAALESCGIEPQGRDADLAGMLHRRIDEQAPSLEDALANASVSTLVRSFFAVAAPYVDMLKGVLRWFERAAAKSGPAQWRVAFEDYEVHVEAFREWIRILETLGTHVESPAISWGDGWALLEALRTSSAVDRAFKAAFERRVDDAALIAKDWLEQYEAGNYGPLPNKLTPKPDAHPWIHDVWSCLLRALTELQQVGLERERALAYGRSVGWRRTDNDALALDSLCQNESDYWLRGLVVAYTVVLTSEEAQKEARAAVEHTLQDIPRATYFVEVNIEDLKTFISLPLWKKRHEFFAAWIASEMLASLEQHDVHLHHENGKITLPFRETIVATVTSTLPSVQLIAERRTDLLSPVGKGRSGGVQPDFGWWRNDSRAAICELVVEVKHYKKAAPTAWGEVFEDYARAHPNAKVLLVNYGPPGKESKIIPHSLRDRCGVIGDLQPAHRDECRRLREAVSGIIGEPLPAWPGDTSEPRRLQAPVIVVDVSSSMSVSLTHLRRLLAKVAQEEGARWLAGVDTEVRGEWPADEAGFEALMALDRQGGTELSAPLTSLLERHEIAVVITDSDGRRSLYPFAEVKELVQYRTASTYVFVVGLQRA